MVARRTLFTTPYQTRKRMRMSPSPALLVAAKRALRDTSEFKFKNTQGPFFAEDAAGVNTELTTIPQGVDVDERIGNRITMTRLDVSLLGRNTGGFRLIIYIPKQADANIANTTNMNTGLDNSRFWILHDQIYGTPTGGNLSEVAVNFKINKTLKMFYTNSTATSYEKNPIKMYVSTNRNGVGLGTFVVGNTKLWYKDM